MTSGRQYFQCRGSAERLVQQDPSQQLPNAHRIYSYTSGKVMDGWLFREQRCLMLQIHQLTLFLQLRIKDLSSEPCFLHITGLGHSVPREGRAWHDEPRVLWAQGAELGCASGPVPHQMMPSGYDKILPLITAFLAGHPTTAPRRQQPAKWQSTGLQSGE